jgi:hypothetical protein
VVENVDHVSGANVEKMKGIAFPKGDNVAAALRAVVAQRAAALAVCVCCKLGGGVNFETRNWFYHFHKSRSD